MALDEIKARGLVMLGCGKMGSAMLAGWIKQGVAPASIWVIEPHPSDWVRETGVNLNVSSPACPAIAVIAVKPQMMGAALPALKALRDCVFLSVAAGTPISAFEAVFGDAAIIRAMPNTPAAVGRGITAIVGNERARADQMDLAETLLGAVGQVVRLSREEQMDAVTALSGSGPAYVFHLIETLAAAGEAEGLPADLAMALAKATVGGAGYLAEQAEESPSQLRVNVTSPGGTTQAALEVLMDDERGLPSLIGRAVSAAAQRSRELGR